MRLCSIAFWGDCIPLTKGLWCWEGLGAGGKGDNRGWDGWMASLIRWMWAWVNSGSWWWTEKPGVLQFMGSQESDTTERLNWTELNWPHVKTAWKLTPGKACRNIQDNRRTSFFARNWVVWYQLGHFGTVPSNPTLCFLSFLPSSICSVNSLSLLNNHSNLLLSHQR